MRLSYIFFAAFFSLSTCQLAFGQLASNASDWPQWRGPNRNGVSPETGLLKKWPKEGPKVRWQVDSVGVGYSSLAVKDGRIFTQGDLNGVEHIIALNADSGKLLWAVQPEPVQEKLTDRIQNELKRLDINSDGQIDEIEALTRLGWTFNNFDSPAETDLEQTAQARSSFLLKQLDKDGDDRFTFAEAGTVLRDYFSRIDASDKTADAKQLAKLRTEQLIKQLDQDGNGAISRSESKNSSLARPFGRADQRDPTTNRGDQILTADEIEKYLIRFEAGKDGVIAAKELKDYYINNRLTGDGKVSASELLGFYGGYRNGMGDGPRGTPTVDGNRVYAEGGNGDLVCLDVATGKTIWHVNLSSDFGGGRPGWGYSESPLVEGEMVIVTPGGRNGTLAALNKQTGELIWRSSGTLQGAHYASAVVAEIGGIRQIVQFARESVFGVTADEGKLMWQYKSANNGTANCATPIIFNDHVFASSSYGTGGGLVKIETKGGQQTAEEIYFDNRMANHHGGIVKMGDYMYGFGNGGLVCMHYMTGEIAWRTRSVGKGSLLAADGMLFLLGEGQQIALAEATPEEYRELGRFSIPKRGRPSWAHPAVAGGMLFIRDQQTLTAFDIKERP